MKSLVLGTAQWGWSVDRSGAFLLLDNWLKAGYSEIDIATNYPINKRPEDFKAAEKILAEYIHAHGLTQQLRITMKIGSMSNMGTPDVNLSPSFILIMAHEYRRVFGKNLTGIMLHWDNRSEAAEIELSMAALNTLSQEGFRPGLSGIKHPEIYVKINETLDLSFDIELKHNPFVSDYDRYKLHFSADKHRFLAYGLNAGGLKFSGQKGQDAQTFDLRGGQIAHFEAKLAKIEAMLPDWNLAFVRPPIVTMNHLGMVYALCSSPIGGAVIGPRTPAQMQEAITWHRNTDMFDYSDVVKWVLKIS
jgi:aryl-alcohol dehydrogenase-like predicted oxidoreductase